MAAKTSRKVLVNVLGLAIVLGMLAGFYFIIVTPRMKEWKEAKDEIKNRQNQLKQLRERFENQDNPHVVLEILEHEISNLQQANGELEKIKKDGVEVKDLPPELNDRDPAIRKELYRDYMKDVMEAQEENIKKQLRDAGITPPKLNLYSDLGSAREAAYYLNRAGGFQGIVNAMKKAKTENTNIVFEEVAMEDFKKGNSRSKGAINIINYDLKMKMDIAGIMSFTYNLQEEDGFYFVEEMEIKPIGSRPGANQPLEVAAKINTLLVFKTEAEEQIKKAAAKVDVKETVKKKGGGGGLLALARGMQEEMERERARRLKEAEKKWYQFWK